MASIREQMKIMKAAEKAAKKSGQPADTEWSSPSNKKDKGGNCPGCRVPYAKMSAGTLRRHAKVTQSGKVKDCPDV